MSQYAFHWRCYVADRVGDGPEKTIRIVRRTGDSVDQAGHGAQDTIGVTTCRAGRPVHHTRHIPDDAVHDPPGAAGRAGHTVDDTGHVTDNSIDDAARAARR